MRFEEFWQTLRNELGNGREFKTIDNYAPFQAQFQNNRIVVIPRSSGEEYYLSRNQLEKAWELAKNLTDEERFKYSIYRMNNILQPSYTIALLRTLTRKRIME